MSRIKKIKSDDPKYLEAVNQKRESIDYKELAKLICSSDPDEVIQIFAPSSSYSNIKVGLRTRKVFHNLHYKLAFKASEKSENDGVFYITVIG